VQSSFKSDYASISCQEFGLAVAIETGAKKDYSGGTDDFPITLFAAILFWIL
jgi:hypothetical protein